MKLNLRAKKLAAILYDTAGDDVKAVHTSLQQISDLLKKDIQFKSLLHSKRISDAQKVEILRAALTNSCHVLVVEFLGLMSKEKSIQIIRQVIKAYTELYKEKVGIIDVHAFVAEKMDTAAIETLQQQLQQSLNKQANLKIEVDDKLLGGIKLRIENTFLDASLKSKLDRLHGELLQS